MRNLDKRVLSKGALPAPSAQAICSDARSALDSLAALDALRLLAAGAAARTSAAAHLGTAA